MRSLLPLLLLTGVASGAALVHYGVLPDPRASAPSSGGIVLEEEDPYVLTGSYVEARDCTVFGGACHVNGEMLSQGRNALLAWHLDTGSTVVAAVESDTNLAEGAPRRAVLFHGGVRQDILDALAASAQLDVRACHVAPVVWQRQGDAFHVAVDEVLELTGEALADRSCCTMPHSVWYRPLVATSGALASSPVVGNPARCRFAGSDGLGGWSYQDANTAFVATFRVPLVSS